MWIVAAYYFGVAGLSRARAGNDGDWLRYLVAQRFAWLQRLLALAGNLRPRFGSAEGAHYWHECRRNAVVFPFMLSWVTFMMMPLVVVAVINADPTRFWVFGSFSLSPSLIGLAFLIGMFLLFSGLYGSGMGKFDIWGKEQMPPFFAIRPMTTPRFVLIKMMAAGVSAFMAWALVLILVLVWAIVEASTLNPRESIVRAAMANASPRALAIFLVAPIGLLALSWGALTTSMWPTLMGRKWVTYTVGIAVNAIFGLAALAGYWVYKHPEMQPRLIAFVPWLVGIVLTMKLGAATWAFFALRKHRLLSSRAMRKWLCGWVVAGAILVAGLSFVVTPTLLLAIGVFLMLPLTRIAVAPVALHWNRHR